MPSPIAHLSTGYAIYRFSKNKIPEGRLRSWRLPLQLALVSGLSLLPDLDILLAAVFNDMQKYHNNFSHSLIFGIPASLVIAGFLYALNRSRFGLWFLVVLLSYELHVIMDFFTGGRGVMLFWPVSQERFQAPFQLFYGVQWGQGWFTILHVWTFLSESLFSILLILTVILLEKRRKAKQAVSHPIFEAKE